MVDTAKTLKGSEILTVYCNKNQMQYHEIAQITSWRVVSPAELKIKNMSEHAVELSESGQQRTKDEKCPIC
jgi:hypothetical protein